MVKSDQPMATLGDVSHEIIFYKIGQEQHFTMIKSTGAIDLLKQSPLDMIQT